MEDKNCPPAIHKGYTTSTVLVSLVLILFAFAAAGAMHTLLQLRKGILPLSDTILKVVFGLDLLAGALLVIAIGVYADSANRFLVRWDTLCFETVVNAEHKTSLASLAGIWCDFAGYDRR